MGAVKPGRLHGFDFQFAGWQSSSNCCILLLAENFRIIYQILTFPLKTVPVAIGVAA